MAEDKICGVSEALKKGERNILLSIGSCVTLIDNALLATGVKSRVGTPPRTDLERVEGGEDAEGDADDEQL